MCVFSATEYVNVMNDALLNLPQSVKLEIW